ncbi:HAD family hydrolase [Streptomyces cavernicola]|uniref:HAD family hydrolase n=1 Tax=Streptomyces cavernicola TaxID=3043613 RepID=A0ABT6SHN4_9ACTN|nr:HAD family hydrolase [Streptomyces sp. B-S-A6]MDI3406928.1 HAD family hydrolase [Streptomyces sp. B-S-A6]
MTAGRDVPCAALFDVDGTLVDTNHLHVTCWWEAFRQAGHRVSTHAVHRAIGLPSEDLVAHLLGEDRDKGRDEEISAAHKALYGTYADRLAPLDGAGDLLNELADRGWRTILVTSAGGSELAALKRAIDADDAIAGTASADDVADGKPAPEPVRRALDLAEVDAGGAVFVGDSVWDMQSATRAGVRPVGLLCGGIPHADLREAGAVEVHRDPADLLARLDTSVFDRVRRD